MSELVVVAIGGHSLVEDKHRATTLTQVLGAGGPVHHLASVVKAGHRVVIVHGNGPQVGMSLLRSALAASAVEPMPLAACVAETQGTIGLQIANRLEAALDEAGCPKRVIPVVTRCLVDQNDPAFQRPTKPVGPVLSDAEVERGRQDGWTVQLDKGRGYRRVVASPRPLEVLEVEGARALLDAGFVVLVGGGGGVPVAMGERRLEGLSAVIDKDYTAALIGAKLGASTLVVLTSVDGVMRGFGTEDEALLSTLSAKDARQMMEAGELGEGSMKPKVDAALKFVEECGGRAVITRAEHVGEAIAGQTGTTIVA